MQPKLCLIFILCGLRATYAQFDPNFIDNRTTIVHLFEWRWVDIAEECERFLGKAGFGGVQVSPPNENVIFNTGTIKRPWFERYQPVSYRLETRSGNEEDFKAMVKRCNATGVRIYIDAVINHMTSNWPNGTQGTGGSSFTANLEKYDAVPYLPEDFNGKTTCTTESGDIENYKDANQVRNCKLLGLNDLDHSKPHVQSVIVEYFDRLISYGVAGFRIDAAKHMNPKDIQAILGKVKNLNTDFGFKKGSRPFVYQEVIDLGNEPISAMEYLETGRVTEFKYGSKLGKVFRKEDKAKWLNNFGEGWGMLPDQKAFVFVDNHDNQRGHGGGGLDILTFRNARLYKMAVSFMLAWPYGTTRIMSSYSWEQNIVNGKDENDWIGPPHDADFNTLKVLIKEDYTCGNGYVCEHRWRELYKMVEFRNIVQNEVVKNWWDNGLNQIAFARNGKGFIVINNDDFPLIQTLNTTLPAGTYCDIISGGMQNKACVGTSVVVSENGDAEIKISNSQSNPFMAIHIQDKLA